MIEIKVQCDCGQKFKFDVEPVHQQMPYAVTCPTCGRDGTGKANATLQQMATPAAVTAEDIAPVAGIAAAPAPAPAAPRLRMSAPSHTTSEAPAADTTMAPPAITGLARHPGDTTAAPAKKSSFGMALLGGLIGTLAGTLIYFLVLKYCGVQYRIVAKFLALGVGALAGWLAEVMGKGEGSKELGAITAVMVLCGLIGSQYLIALGWWNEELALLGKGETAYSLNVQSAKLVVQAVPTGSESEIRNFLAKQASEDGSPINPASVNADDVKAFHDKTLPEDQALASGKMTEAQYDAQNGIDPAKEKESQKDEESTFKSVFVLLLISRSNLFALAGAAGLAYKLSTNA